MNNLNENFIRLAVIYNTSGHIFVYNDILFFKCKYCSEVLGELEYMSNCISDHEKMIKNLIE